MESPKNLAYFCPEHAPKPDVKLIDKPLNSYIGKFVKKRFTVTEDDKETLRMAAEEMGVAIPKNIPNAEHMWVKVTGVRNGKFVGNIDNEPVAALSCHLGLEVEVDPNEVENVIEP